MNTTDKFSVGDTIKVATRIREGGKERAQNFTGIAIAIRGRGENKTFTVRRQTGAVSVERIWPLESPSIASITVVKKSPKVRRSKLYYLRQKQTEKGLARF